VQAADAGIVLGFYRSRHSPEILNAAHRLGVRRLDTAFNYHHFSSHRVLAAAVGDLLGDFQISTKVGYFASPQGSEHSLAPSRLLQAVAQIRTELGRAPDVVLLHNPEHSLNPLGDAAATTALEQAMAALAAATANGDCRSWGVSSWNPHHLLRAVRGETSRDLNPSVLMVQAGLLVNAQRMSAAEALAERFSVPLSGRWGMSPFGGSDPARVFAGVNCRTFLSAGQHATLAQAAFRVAFHLPGVRWVAVGTDDVSHLEELVASQALHVDEDQIARYRKLLDARAGHKRD